MGKRKKNSESNGEGITATATDHVVAAASQVEKKAGNAIIGLLVGIITLLLNLIRGLLASILGAVGGLISALGSTLNGVSNILKAPFLGLARAISPLDHSATSAEGSTDAPAAKPKKGKKAKKAKKGRNGG